MPPLASEFTVRFANLCTQMVTPSATPPGRGVVTEFLLNNCGLTVEEITKVFKYRKQLLSAKSTKNLEEVLELLNSRGLTTPAQIRRVVLCNPEFLFLRLERNLKSKLSLLSRFITEEDITKIINKDALIFSAREDKLKSTILLLQRLGVEGQALSELVGTQPRLLRTSEENVMVSFKQAEDLGLKKGSKKFAETVRVICGTRKETLERRLQCLISLGFSENQVSEMSRRHPMILGLTEENLKCHVDFLVKSAGLTFADLVKHPTMFRSSLEKRLIPRHRVIESLKSMQMWKTEVYFPKIARLSEKRFLEIYVDSNAESSVLRAIYHCGKAGKFSIYKETSSESDVGPRLEAGAPHGH
jgi:mTERF domain-containing protein